MYKNLNKILKISNIKIVLVIELACSRNNHANWQKHIVDKRLWRDSAWTSWRCAWTRDRRPWRGGSRRAPRSWVRSSCQWCSPWKWVAFDVCRVSPLWVGVVARWCRTPVSRTWTSHIGSSVLLCMRPSPSGRTFESCVLLAWRADFDSPFWKNHRFY